MKTGGENSKNKLAEELVGKFKTRRASVAVVGLGYVGLPLAVAMAKAGFNVVGIERKYDRRRMVNSGRSYIADVPAGELRETVKKGRLKAVNTFKIVQKVDAVCICVPTPLKHGTKQPDLFYVRFVSQQISKYLRKGQVIVLESTTYPGTTEEMVRPMLEKSGLKAGRDFFLAFSPERVDPGNQIFRLKNTPKIIGGLTPACTRTASALYGQVVKKVIPVSSPRIAEMEKLLENVFRNVNIAFVNELAIICRKMKMDVWEVIRAASTKPYGFMTFYPGPGIGGHCIPIDPFYLSWKAKKLGIKPEFIELAARFNDHMPYYVVNILANKLRSRDNRGKKISGSKILVLGAAYKKDIADFRESPSIIIMGILMKKGARVIYNDPYVRSMKIGTKRMNSVKLTDRLLKSQDAVIIATDHSKYNYRKIVDCAKIVLDTRNALHGIRADASKIIKL